MSALNEEIQISVHLQGIESIIHLLSDVPYLGSKLDEEKFVSTVCLFEFDRSYVQ